ncbi:MAG: hypothetical protein IJ503_01300 [Akkermansia sp.]|nr:hypothetical protein [Akkermansia sp.]
MKPLPAVLLLLTAALSYAAEKGIDITQLVAEREATLTSLSEKRTAVNKTVSDLLGEIPPMLKGADTSLPERSGSDTVAVADGGMVFDAANSRIAYINNVRLADPRLELRSSERLYIQFPQKTLKQGKSSAKGSATTGLNTQTAGPTETTESIDSTDSQDTPPAQISELTRNTPPVQINAAVTMVDAMQNTIYLESASTTGATVVIEREQNKLQITAQENARAFILADSNGDIYISAADIDLKWSDSKGNISTLHNKQGRAYYHSETHRLYFDGPTEVQTPDGGISADDYLILTLTVEEKEGGKSDFMPQFTDIHIKGIEAADARGNVRITRPSADDKPAAEVCGEVLHYDGLTGDVKISGSGTRLVYGTQELCTDDSLHLAENGDITLQGDTISGKYSRPAADKTAAPIQGTFSTSGCITFTAADHTITLPNGITAQDSLSNFSAQGKLVILLQPDTEAKAQDRARTGMVNLAIAQHKDIAAIEATGGIAVQHRSNEQEEGLALTADDARLNLLTAEATFTSAAGKTTNLQYNGYRLAAADEQNSTRLYLAPNGDLTMTGAQLTAELPGKKTTTKATCTESMTLNREAGVLKLGPKSRMVADNGILSANGELELALYPGPAEKNRPIMERYPHLVFNYAGLKQADTANGGTLQAKQGSMECSGAIHVEMLPDSAAGGDLGSVRLATAEGNVAIAGKDSTGRMMRAMGDRLSVDGATGNKVLSGDKVSLQDANNTHIASGAGARVVLDKKNNVRISGAKQSTSATRIKNQIEKNQKK